MKETYFFDQVSTGTGIMIYYYNVSVIVPSTSIVGGSEYHVDKGSAIQLTCVIRNVSHHHPARLFYFSFPLRHNVTRCGHLSQKVESISYQFTTAIVSSLLPISRCRKSRSLSFGITTTGWSTTTRHRELEMSRPMTSAQLSVAVTAMVAGQKRGLVLVSKSWRKSTALVRWMTRKPGVSWTTYNNRRSSEMVTPIAASPVNWQYTMWLTLTRATIRAHHPMPNQPARWSTSPRVSVRHLPSLGVFLISIHFVRHASHATSMYVTNYKGIRQAPKWIPIGSIMSSLNWTTINVNGQSIGYFSYADVIEFSIVCRIGIFHLRQSTGVQVR